MKFKRIINFSTTTFLSFTLLTSAAQASVINSFTWDAQCTDCFSETVGVANEAGSTFVSGEISLADYNFGDPITTANFNSFTYNGPSRWIESFTVDNVDYLSGMLTDTGLLSLQFTSTFGELTAEPITNADIEALTIALQDAESAEQEVDRKVNVAAMRLSNLRLAASKALAEFREGPNNRDAYDKLLNGYKNLTIAKAEGRDQTRALNQIAAAEENLSTIAAYQPVLAARKAVSDAIKANSALYGPQLSAADAEVRSANIALNQAISEQARQEVANQAYTVNILQSGDWDISLLSQDFDVVRPLDFGTAARVLPVPEPSTLAIFALGIMGLASRKFKK